MYEKTLGIVLCTIPYNDHTQFVRIYTEHFGKVTYSISISRSRKASATRTMLAPMTIVEMEVKHQPDSEIQKIKEMRALLSPYSRILANPYKTAQCMFLAELADKCIHEVEANAALFSFLKQCIELLDITEQAEANFHVAFIIRFCHLLGFRMNTESYRDGAIFDLNEGVFTTDPIYHPYYLQPESAKRLFEILLYSFGQSNQIAINREQRDKLVDVLLLYLKLHIPDMGEIKSVDVLKDLFD